MLWIFFTFVELWIKWWPIQNNPNTFWIFDDGFGTLRFSPNACDGDLSLLQRIRNWSAILSPWYWPLHAISYKLNYCEEKRFTDVIYFRTTLMWRSCKLTGKVYFHDTYRTSFVPFVAEIQTSWTWHLKLCLSFWVPEFAFAENIQVGMTISVQWYGIWPIQAFHWEPAMLAHHIGAHDEEYWPQ